VEQIAQIGSPDPALVANVALAQGRDIEARALFEARVAAGDDRREVFGPLIQILLQANDTQKASETALKFVDQLSSEDIRKIAELAESGGATKGAAMLLDQVWKRDAGPSDAYLAARAFAGANDHQRARELLRSAVKAGFSDRTMIERDRAIFSFEEGWIERLFSKEPS
jgi:thioredoxin-like negative regulator of GroEL